MNQLPQIFRQSQSKGFNRQGPFFNLRLNQTFYKSTSTSVDKTHAKMRTRLSVNRYSIDKPTRQSTRKVGYSTISYDYLNDPEFYGTKGQKDHSQSYSVLIDDRRKGADILGLKVAAYRGFKQEYSEELKIMEKKYKNSLKQTESTIHQQITTLRQTLSELRRETGFQLRSMKNQLKQFNNELLHLCEQCCKVEKDHLKCLKNIQYIQSDAK